MAWNLLAVLSLLTLSFRETRAASPFMWDQDEDGIDDRLTLVSQNGIEYAFENFDPEGRLRFEVSVVNNTFQYGGYVLFDHLPGPADSVNVMLLGAQVVTIFHSVNYIRIRATYPSLSLIVARPDVERIEAVTLMYPLNWRGGHGLGVRRGAGAPFPTLEDGVNPTGEGSVVAVLDTGINDGPMGAYPGHGDLSGKIGGGAWFAGPGPNGYTPWNGTANPSQSAAGLTSYHGTHVAATIAGGTRSRAFGGVAPGASLIDVKVLDDGGMGFGLAEGIEWCIQNRNRSWGNGTSGIDVINLSLSGTDASDGQDCACQLVNAAAALGVVVVASSGNDALCGYLPAPGAADGAITVGAADPQGTADPDDDLLADFSNEGPRHTDEDGGSADEMKPDVVAPGVDVISANGSPLGSGCGYQAASGTSMSAAFVSGVAALLREASTALSPAEVKSILHRTARHRTSGTKACSQGSDPFGLDGRYHAGWGFGQVDALAAYEELVNGSRTQFVGLDAVWNSAAGRVTVAWTTQREADLTGFHVERAPDVLGQPGTFAAVTALPVPAMGHPDLNTGNRTTYSYENIALQGARLWYRVVTTGGLQSDVSPAVRVRTEDPAALATMNISHNTPETDLTLSLGSGMNPLLPDWSAAVVLPDAIETATASTLSDLVHYTLVVPLYAGEGASAYLPPTSSQPWWFDAVEGGNPLRSGYLTDFRIDAGPTAYETSTPVPASTMEGGSTTLWIPGPTSAVGPIAGPRVPALEVGPNPFAASARILLRLDEAGPVRLTVHDVTGREVRLIASRFLDPGTHAFSWDGRDAGGTASASGKYFVRVSLPGGVRVQPVVRVN